MAIGSRRGWRLDPLNVFNQSLSSASVVRGLKLLPEKICLTYDQIQALKSSIKDSNRIIEDKALIKVLIDFNGWLQQQLLERKISIKRLKMLIFGESPKGHKPSELRHERWVNAESYKSFTSPLVSSPLKRMTYI